MHFTLYISKTLKSVSLNENFEILAGGTFLPQKLYGRGGGAAKKMTFFIPIF